MKFDDLLITQVNNVIPMSRWFTIDNILKVYVRAGKMADPWNRESVKTICVANILELPKAYLGRGVFRNFMMRLEMRAKELGYAQISVENVVPELLQEQLVKNGYTPHIRTCDSPRDSHTFYKPLS